MKLSKRLLAMLLCIVFTVSLLPAAGLAIDLTDLDALVAAKVFEKDGSTYTLQKDFTIPEKGITIAKDVTIDLNGYILAVDVSIYKSSSTSNEAILFAITDGAEVKLTNSCETPEVRRFLISGSGEHVETEAEAYWEADVRGGTIVTTSWCNWNQYVITVTGEASLTVDGSVGFYNGRFREIDTEDYLSSNWYQWDYDYSTLRGLFYVGEKSALKLDEVNLNGFGRWGHIDFDKRGTVVTNLGSVTMQNCTVESSGDMQYDDDAPASADYCYDLPAVYNAGTLTVDGCEFGAASVYNMKTLSVHDSEFYSVPAYEEQTNDGGWDTDSARIYNKGDLIIGGDTRIGDIFCEAFGGVVMYDGSTLTVDEALPVRTGEYASIPSVMISLSPMDNLKALNGEFTLGEYSTEIRYASGIAKHDYDIDVSIFTRIAGFDLVNGSIAEAVYADISPLNVDIADIVLNSESTTGLIDLEIEGLRSSDVAYIQRYLKMAEVAIENKLDADQFSKELNDPYLSGSIVRLSDWILGEINEGDKENREVTELLRAEFDTDTLYGVLEGTVAALLGMVGFWDVADETQLAIEPYISGEKFEFTNAAGEKITVDPVYKFDRTIMRYKHDAGTIDDWNAMQVHYGHRYLDDDDDGFFAMIVLANGLGFDRRVGTDDNQYYVHDRNLYTKRDFAAYAETADDFQTKRDDLLTGIYDIAPDTEISMACKYHYVDDYLSFFAEPNGQPTESELKFDFETGTVSFAPTFDPEEYAGYLPLTEVEDMIAVLNGMTDAEWVTIVKTGVLPDQLFFNDKFVAPKAVQEYYREKLDTVKRDAEILVDTAYNLLTGGSIAGLDTKKVGGDTVLSLFNEALCMTISAETGTVSSRIDVDASIQNLFKMFEKVFNTINSDDEATAVIKKYADALFFKNEERNKDSKYAYPEEFDDLCEIAEELLNSLLGNELDQMLGEEDVIGTIVGWLSDPSDATAFIFNVLDKMGVLPMLGEKMEIGFARVTEVVADDPKTEADESAISIEKTTDAESGNEKAVFVESFEQLLNEYGRYELCMDTMPVAAVLPELTKQLGDKTLLGYKLGEITLGHINVLPTNGTESDYLGMPDVTAIGNAQEEGKPVAKYNLVGDGALWCEDGFSNATLTYWPDGNKDSAKTLTGEDTTGYEISIEKTADNVKYLCTYSVDYKGKTWTSEPASFIVPGCKFGSLFIQTAKANTSVLTKGDTVIGTIEKTEVVGGASQQIVEFKDLAVGVYNLKVYDNSGNVKTYLVEVLIPEGESEAAAFVDGESHSTTDKALVVELKGVQTEVIINEADDEIPEEEADMDQVVVGGLNNVVVDDDNLTFGKEAEQQTIELLLDPQTQTKLVLEVTNIAEPAKAEAEAITAKLEEVNEDEGGYNNELSYIDLTIYLRDAATETTQARVSELNDLITIYVPYDTNRADIHVYRDHDGVVEAIPEGKANANQDGEYFEITEGFIVLHIRKFSSYAVSYTAKRQVICEPGVSVTETMILPGETVTLTPAKGYENPVVTDTLGANVTVTGNTFTMPATDVTAEVSKKSYTITCGTGVSANVASAEWGTTVTLTPEEGYENAVVTVLDPEEGTVSVVNGSFTMPKSAVEISVSKIRYTVTCEEGVEADPAQIEWGETVTLTLTRGYQDPVVNGGEVNVVSGSFVMPMKNVTVSVSKTSYQIHCEDNVTADKTTAVLGETVTLEVARGYRNPTVITAEGTQIAVTDGTFTMPADNVTISVSEEGVYTYTITCGKGVSANRLQAGEGETVKITVAEGYESPVVTTENGKTVTVKDNRFTMPAANVKITVSESAESTDSGSGSDSSASGESQTADAADSVSACNGDDSCPMSRFGDVDSKAWYHNGIHYCLENGIMNGMSETEFKPGATASRAMIVMMLWRLEGSPSVDHELSFRDVPADGWYTEAVRWAQATGVVNGLSADTFAPNAPITREQLAKILYGYAQSKGEGFTGAWVFLLPFEDNDQISGWANEAVHWCYMKGIINGRTETTFVPGDTATRAETAAMFQRFCEAMKK